MTTTKKKSSSKSISKSSSVKLLTGSEYLTEIIGEFDPKEIATAMLEWDKSMVLCDNSKTQQLSLEHARYSLESAIFGLEFADRAMKRTQHKNLYQYQPFYTPPPNMAHAIKEIEFHLKLHKATLNYVKWAKKFLFDENYMFLQAIIQVFTLGEKFGLKPIIKPGLGRGNQSKMLNFVGIITGISDRKKLRRYQALFVKFKTDFKYQSKVLSLPQLLSLKALITTAN